MRLSVLSDLHVEVAGFEPAPTDADLVVLAGDIHNGELAPRWARAAYPDREIVMVAGNHEFYDGEYFGTLERMRAAARETGVRLLENEAVVVGGVRLLGCTLWTDFRLFEAPGRTPALSAQMAMDANRRLLADYAAIRIADGAGQRLFSPEDAARLHHAAREWLRGELQCRWDGPTVVVTHHLPSWRSVHPAFAAWVTNAGFASELDELVERADLWIHGHTHTTQDYRIGASRVVCNPRGYPRPQPRSRPPEDPPEGADAEARVAPPPQVFENPDFDPGLLVEVRAR
jgi:predicted phosphodiesterase